MKHSSADCLLYGVDSFYGLLLLFPPLLLPNLCPCCSSLLCEPLGTHTQGCQSSHTPGPHLNYRPECSTRSTVPLFLLVVGLHLCYHSHLIPVSLTCCARGQQVSRSTGLLPVQGSVPKGIIKKCTGADNP